MLLPGSSSVVCLKTSHKPRVETHDLGMQAGTILQAQESIENRPCGECASSPSGRRLALVVPVDCQRSTLDNLEHVQLTLFSSVR